MRLKTLHIKNYRSIRDQLIDLGKYNCLVGANGAGKSTVLCALNVLFREGGTATDTTTLHIEDFHAKNVADPVEITATFHELSDSAKADLAGYVRNGELVVSAIAEYDVVSASATVKQYGERKVFKPFAEFFRQLNDKALVGPLKAIYVALREAFPELPEPSTKDAMTSALRLYEEARPDECELIRSEDQFYGVSKGSSRLSPHIQWVYIPAVKDAADEQSESRNTALGKLLARAVRSKVNFQEQIKRIADAARAEYGKLLQDNQQALDEISASLASRLVQWAHPSAGLAVKWQQDAKKSVQVEEPIAGILAKEGEFEGQLVILPLQFRTRPIRNVAPVVQAERGVNGQPVAA